jgi:hypothetical protein
MSILGIQPNHTMLDPNGAMVGAKPERAGEATK